MPDPFDVDHEWLGIPPEEHAADRQMARLRTFQSGKHGALSQWLLNEEASARLCLLQPQKKVACDRRLRSELETDPTRPFQRGPAEAGRDPRFGVPKWFCIWFDYQGKHYVRVVPEGNGVLLP